jgi:hypothetical protein
MGMIDSFYDEDSTCCKCRARMVGDWQTKHLQRLHGSWSKGDFLQYRNLANPREGDRKRKRGKVGLPSTSCESEGYVSDAPLLFNGKVPVHQTCDNCSSRLVAYARILDGKFTGIVEMEADREEGELVIDREEITARTLREELARRLSNLQESCEHEESEWMPFEWAPGHRSGRVRVCNRCEKILESGEDKRLMRLPNRCPVHGTMKEPSWFCPRCAEEWP